MDRLDAIERRHGLILPAAFRELYAWTDGTAGMVGESLIQLLPLDEVGPALGHRSVEQDADPPGSGWPDAPAWTRRWFVFGDYLISSHAYLIRLSPTRDDPGPVAIWHCGQDPHLWPVAPSFAAFLDLWASDAARALLGSDEPARPGS